MYLSYHEALQSNEWKEQANSIRNRDNNTCQRCGVDNSHFYKTGWTPISKLNLVLINYIESESGKLHFCILGSSQRDKIYAAYTKLTKPEVLEDLQDLHLFIHSIKKDWNNSDFNPSVCSVIPRMSFGHLNTKVATEIEEKLKHREKEWHTLIIDRESFFLGRKEDRTYIKYKSMHVHHRCYRQGVEIWAQDDEEYITMCNICHLLIHQNYSIPIYGHNGQLIQLENFCDRCGGSGYLPEYSHVQGGVCFKCGGLGGQISNDSDNTVGAI